jgi:hypothetical protein
MSQGGRRDRWAAIRAQRADQFEQDVEKMRQAYLAAHPADPIEAFATAVTGLGQPKRRNTHLAEVMRVAAKGKADLAKIEARQAERATRNGLQGQRAYAHYERVRQEWLAEQDKAEDQRGPSLLVAAAMGLDTSRFRIY